MTSLHETLSAPPYNLRTLVCSIDDLYLPHSDQLALAAAHPTNPLVQHRGQPSTHDVDLGVALFAAISDRQSDIKIPSYDKSAFNGTGDRLDESQWEIVNRSGEPPVEIVIFEGWCVGFRALSESDLEKKWRAATELAERLGSGYQGRLGKLSLESVRFVNEKLMDYDAITE